MGETGSENRKGSYVGVMCGRGARGRGKRGFEIARGGAGGRGRRCPPLRRPIREAAGRGPDPSPATPRSRWILQCPRSIQGRGPPRLSLAWMKNGAGVWGDGAIMGG